MAVRQKKRSHIHFGECHATSISFENLENWPQKMPGLVMEFGIVHPGTENKML